MPAKKNKNEINLLPQKGFEATTTGRILAWILSTFRIIVIVTEIMVMIAFLSRFWFDAQNSDLSEKLLQKQAVISASRKFELDFKDTQKRLQVYSELVSASNDKKELILNIAKTVPSDVVLTQIRVMGTTIEVSGVTSNEKSIQQFLANLDSGNMLKNFSLKEIKNDLQNNTNLMFTLTGETGII